MSKKILAVSQVSNEILHIVKVEAGLIAEPEPEEESPSTVASVALDCGYYDAEDELPYENKVFKFGDFSKRVDEAYVHLQFDHWEDDQKLFKNYQYIVGVIADTDDLITVVDEHLRRD